jgi:uncharacterized protein
MTIPAPTLTATYTAFSNERRIGQGRLDELAMRLKEFCVANPGASVLIFNDSTGREVDIDLRGTEADILGRIAKRFETSEVNAPSPRGPGRPKLGVVAREITLLPRHWEWLTTQPGGASVALRKLVDEARRANSGRDRCRAAQDAAYRFMSAIAGNQPGFEEAVRALYAKDKGGFSALLDPWPLDVREHAHSLARSAFEAQSETGTAQ